MFEENRTLVLDGGLGTHLAARGNDISGELWSAAILNEHPDEVRAAHEDFFNAGAQVATTCSYQVTFDGFAQIGMGNGDIEKLLRKSVKLAREATGGLDGRYVAASVGPYGAGPGAGTEYDGAYGIGVNQLAQWHRPRMEILADSGADVLLMETVPNIYEVEALAAEISRLNIDGWLSVTLDGTTLGDGTRLDEVLNIVNDTPAIKALSINCCSADEALSAAEVFAQGTDKAFGVYPNSGETWDHVNRKWLSRDEGSVGLVEAVPQLLDLGVSFIGGCCRVTPREIEAIVKQVS